MINREQTHLQFGYWPEDLRLKSNKRIIATCEICWVDREISKSAYRDSCATCQRKRVIKIATSASIRARTGKPMPQQTKDRISAAHFGKRGRKATIKTRNLLSDIRMGTGNPFFGKHHSAATKKLLSDKRKANPTRLGIPAAHGRGDYFISRDGRKIWMRSSWEIKTAKYLDDNNFIWDYEAKIFPINYLYKNENKLGTFITDFVIFKDDSFEIWEVKGYWRDDARAKYEAFREQYPQVPVQLLTKIELKNLGIL